jgi:hypothetical protein
MNKSIVRVVRTTGLALALLMVGQSCRSLDGSAARSPLDCVEVVLRDESITDGELPACLAETREIFLAIPRIVTVRAFCPPRRDDAPEVIFLQHRFQLRAYSVGAQVALAERLGSLVGPRPSSAAQEKRYLLENFARLMAKGRDGSMWVLTVDRATHLMLAIRLASFDKAYDESGRELYWEDWSEGLYEGLALGEWWSVAEPGGWR